MRGIIQEMREHLDHFKERITDPDLVERLNKMHEGVDAMEWNI